MNVYVFILTKEWLGDPVPTSGLNKFRRHCL